MRLRDVRALGRETRPTITAELKNGPLDGRRTEVDVVEGRPPKTIDVPGGRGLLPLSHSPCASKAAASISPVVAILAAAQPATAGTRSQISRSRVARRSGSARCGGSKWWRPSNTSRV